MKRHARPANHAQALRSKWRSSTPKTSSGTKSPISSLKDLLKADTVLFQDAIACIEHYDEGGKFGFLRALLERKAVERAGLTPRIVKTTSNLPDKYRKTHALTDVYFKREDLPPGFTPEEGALLSINIVHSVAGPRAAAIRIYGKPLL